VLRRMGRQVTAERVNGLIERLRGHIERLVLRTTFMVGYPGEREEDFDELIDFVERIRFERLGAFVFSPEEGTKAAGLDGTVPEEIAAERYERLMDTQARISGDFHQSLVGAEFEMIVDDIDGESGTATGRTYMDAPEIDGNLVAAGSVEEGAAFLRVRITGASAYDLEGGIVTAGVSASGNT
ncbi:MAG: 30S ribosomal protein S12 methylthiotransferase RimO, partial [Candidatus Latescibacteria bacterium]|nr:30S ribosomal protein S12 methylthiotransferase RimO [Candidatus Latescibacterota bacterium]